jgi:hypothetical protein
MDATLSKDTADGLVNDLSTSAVVLTDSQSPEFIQSMKRWSKVDLSIPSAIIVPAKESDIFKIVHGPNIVVLHVNANAFERSP